MQKTILFITFLPLFALAKNLELKKPSGLLEYQSKIINNNQDSTNEEWSDGQLQQLVGSVNAELNIWKHKFDFNAIVRHYQSPIFKKTTNPTKYIITPYKLIGRNFFKARHEKTEGSSITEATLSRLTYTWEDNDLKINAGRINISYGQGQTINPINPFNYNYSISNSNGVDQGNDGVELVFQKDPKLKLHLYLLADKSFTDYDERVTKTLMLRGEWLIDNKTEVNYILGEDQQRHKYGAEIKRHFYYGLGYIQAVRYSQRLDKNDASSEGLFHNLAGFELDLSKTWTARLEIGKFNINEEDPELETQNYLPFENFATLLNLFRVNEEITTELAISTDNESEANFYKISISYHNLKDFEVRAFSSGLSTKPKEEIEFAHQELIPTDFGMALRYEF